MALGRSYKVYQYLGGGSFSVLLEQRGQSDVLVFENYSIALLSSNEFELLRKSYSKVTDAYGCAGILRFNAGDHVIYFLVLITGIVSVGKIGSCEIYRVLNVSMISLRGISSDSEKVSEIKKLLTCGTFYFSWSSKECDSFNLTLSVQKSQFCRVVDNRFFWNRMLHIPFIRNGIQTQNWLCILLCGSVEIRTVYVGSKQAKAVIISRLSSERAGTRFHVRGVDDNGHVANFCESEQIIYLDNEVSSFLQIRGSVPLFWEQPGINVGSHKIKMSRGPELSQPAFNLHMHLLKNNYGNQVIVNLLASSLVGSKEGEATLSTAFQTHHKSSESHLDVPHILFDYHAEVKNGSSKNLTKLKSKVVKYVQKFDFYTRRGSEVIREQYGTVRTNCTDCLDRTNCIQTYLGLELLHFQLLDLNLTDKSNILSRFEELFKQMWIINGNELSKMYAGTGALQGGSKIMDGARSVGRTIQNNLLDFNKQEAIDILLLGASFNSDLADRARVLLPSKFLTAPRSVLKALVDKYEDFVTPVSLRIAVGTYNINGGKHFRSIVYKDVSLTDWLLDAHKTYKSDLINLESVEKESEPIDIYAIGFEEMVDLDAKNIMNTSSENAKAWASELHKTLNRDTKYALLTFQQLVGVCLYVFVRPEHAPYIRDLAVDHIKTGLGGATGNKGTVAIRFLFHSTSLCFVCSHFAAGQNASSDRNNDYAEAVKRISFPLGRTLLSHDYVFWCGDFNYRLNHSADEVKGLIGNENWSSLYLADQLKCEMEASNVFHGFSEGQIRFPPTYKYDLFSDDYDTSEKSRIPSWTDRVLWKHRGDNEAPTVYWYGRAELKQSDHRPVIAVLNVKVKKIQSDQRSRIFDEALTLVGPPDGSVLLQFENLLSDDIFRIVSEEEESFMEPLKIAMNTIGAVRFIKYIHEMIWVAFVDHEKALEAHKVREIQIAGHDLTIHLRSPHWPELLSSELKLCSDNTVPLCQENKELNLKKESESLFSKLSSLSFEELEDITISSTVSHGSKPAVPPPPKILPSRPSLPPSRPAPPPPQCSNSVQSGGFSDIFSSFESTRLPVSSSSGSLLGCLLDSSPDCPNSPPPSLVQLPPPLPRRGPPVLLTGKRGLPPPLPKR